MNKVIENSLLKIDYNLLFESQHHVYLKDSSGRYVKCNAAQAHSFGFKKYNDVIGCVDEDVLPEEEARILKINDKEVMATQKPKIILEFCSFSHSEDRIMISFKMPVYGNNKNKVIGVLGISASANDNSLFSLLPDPLKHLCAPKKDFQPIIQSPISHENKKISKRERECLEFLSKGMTAKEIARVLDLSPRTIEFYIENLKKKFVCFTRAELIAKTFNII